MTSTDTDSMEALLFRVEQCLLSAIGLDYENAGVPIDDLRHLLSLARKSSCAGDDEVERVAEAIFDAMDVQDGLTMVAAERYAEAAIAAMQPLPHGGE